MDPITTTNQVVQGISNGGILYVAVVLFVISITTIVFLFKLFLGKTSEIVEVYKSQIIGNESILEAIKNMHEGIKNIHEVDNVSQEKRNNKLQEIKISIDNLNEKFNQLSMLKAFEKSNQ